MHDVSLLCADVQGSDNPIPLSPQWLLSKSGKSKTGMGTVVFSHCSLSLCVHFVYFIFFQFCIGFDMLTGFTFTGSSVPP